MCAGGYAVVFLEAEREARGFQVHLRAGGKSGCVCIFFKETNNVFTESISLEHLFSYILKCVRAARITCVFLQ